MQHKISHPHLVGLRVICAIGIEWRKPTCQPHGLIQIQQNRSWNAGNGWSWKFEILNTDTLLYSGTAIQYTSV